MKVAKPSAALALSMRPVDDPELQSLNDTLAMTLHNLYRDTPLERFRTDPLLGARLSLEVMCAHQFDPQLQKAIGLLDVLQSDVVVASSIQVVLAQLDRCESEPPHPESH